jgi:hypothetical protein
MITHIIYESGGAALNLESPLQLALEGMRFWRRGSRDIRNTAWTLDVPPLMCRVAAGGGGEGQDEDENENDHADHHDVPLVVQFPSRASRRYHPITT